MTAPSCRSLAVLLPGDLFARLGADVPGGGHIPFIAAYLGCQAGLGGGLRQNRALLSQVPACWGPRQQEVFAKTSSERLLCADSAAIAHSPEEAGPTPHSGPRADGMGEGDSF